MSFGVRACNTALITLAGLFLAEGPVRAYPEAPADPKVAFGIIDTLQMSSRIDSAFVLLEAWIPAARVERDTTLLTGLLHRQGAFWAVHGRGGDAEPVLREANELAEARRDTLSICGTLRWLGVAVGLQGRRAESDSLRHRLLDLARATGDRRHEGWGLVGLAWQAYRGGRAADAVELYREAVAAFEEVGDPSERSWSLNGLGVALSGVGDYRGAMDCYQRAAALARQASHPTVESLAVNNLGALEFSRGDPGLAQKHFERALELQQVLGIERESFIPTLNITICQTYLGRYADADAILDTLLTRCRRERWLGFEGSVLNQMARVRSAEGRHHAAAALFRESLRLDTSLPFKTRLEAVTGLSSELAALDSSEAAIAALEASAPSFRDGDDRELWLQLARETGEQLQQNGRSQEALDYVLPANRQAQRLGLDEHRVGALITAARCYEDIGRPDSALHLLNEASTVWESYRSSPLDPEWRELRSSESRALYTDLAALMLGDEDDPPEPRIRDVFDRLQRFKARTLLERMLGPGKELDDAMRSEEATPITLAALQEHVLEPHEVLLDFYVGSRTSLLFLVSRDACRVVRLPSVGELEPQVHLYHELISAPAPADPAADAEMIAGVGLGISRLLLGELAPFMPEEGRLVIAPDGVLNLVPFASLPLDGNGRDPLPQLIDRWECVRVPSATILARQHLRQANGSPAFDLRALAVAATETDRGDPLPGAVREARQLAQRYSGVEARIGPGTSSPDSLGLAEYDLLHLATHTAVDDQRPWQSAICFSPAGETDLRAEEIASMRLPARLAVLSSCESAGGRILSGEGVLGLSSAFISAGVPVVVATLWPVDDRTTSRFMERFYAELADDQPVSAALRQAQLAARRDPRSARPFHWAGFVTVGEAGTHLPLEPTQSFPWQPAIGAIMLLGFGLALMRHRRGRR